MAKPEEIAEGKPFRVTREFRDEFISPHISFDDGLHEPVTVRVGMEGVIHSLNSPDGMYLGYMVGNYPALAGGFGAADDGMRVQTSINDIEML